MGRILRNDALAAPAGVSRRVPGMVFDAARRAEGVLAEARAQAERMAEEALAERERLRAQADEEGLRQGLARAAAVLALAAAERDRLLADARQELLKLALAVAEKVVAREVERGGGVAAVAEQALSAVRRRRVVTLRVHPEDAATLRREEGRLARLVAGAPALGLVEDRSISRGGVVVETEAGTVDARVETRFGALEAALLEGEER